MSKYDDVLRPFVALMEKELHANSHKGDREGWLQMTEEQALGDIEYHVSKLSKAMTDMNPDGMREYAADVANLCMMLLDIGGSLADALPESTPPGWVPCSPEWLNAGGDCAGAPRWFSGPIGNHYHPKVGEHGYMINTWQTGVSAYDPVTKRKAQVDRQKYRSLTVAKIAAIQELKKLISEV